MFLETRKLVDGVVQLGVGVAELLAAHEELEALRKLGIRAVTLAQRRHLARIVHHECGLHELLLAVLAEDGVDQLALAHRCVRLDAQTPARFAQLLLGLARDVVSGLFADGVRHGQAAERGFERDLPPVDREFRRAVHG